MGRFSSEICNYSHNYSHNYSGVPFGVAFGFVPLSGFVETDMTAEILSSSKGDIIKSQSPLNRVGQPEEIANAVMMMAMDGMEYATGSIIDLNGASYLR